MGKKWIGNYPKVGIRPTIDGRLGGIRESLEEVTMGMALMVGKLLEQEIKYPDGSPVQWIVSDSTIGGVAEAARCEEKFSREEVAITITVTPSWCYPSETMDQNPTTIKAIWGINGTERPGAVYLAAAVSAYGQKGMPVFSIYGRDVQDITDRTIPEDVKARLLEFTQSALAVALLRGRSYLSIGSVSMGIAGCVVNEKLFHNYLGMRNEYVDMSEFIRRMQLKIYDEEEYHKALSWVKRNCKEGIDVNLPELQRTTEQKEQDWETVVKMALIARDLMEGNPRLAEMGYAEEALGHYAIAAGFQGQRAWTDFMPNGDFIEAILCSSFDWNGIREPYILATENDNLNAITMLFGHYLTHGAQIFADVRTYWSPEAVKRVTGLDMPGSAPTGFIHLSNSGPAALDGTGEQRLADGTPAMKPFWAISDDEARRCLEAVTWCPSVDFFRGGGYSTRYTTRGGMPVTMARLNLVEGLGPVLQLAEGYTIDLPEQMEQIISARTNETWPATWFVPKVNGKGAFKDVYSVMHSWGSNHGVINYGHIGGLLITLASMLRIPVSMHNVEEERIFRPAVWEAFGADDLTGADYRACQTYGPLY